MEKLKNILKEEFTWLLKQLHATNRAIVPVLNATRLKQIKAADERDEILEERASAPENGHR